MLRDLGHVSPVQHASFTFYIHGLWRAMTHQLVRHRRARYSQRSQRYVEDGEFDHVVPPRLQDKTVEEDGPKCIRLGGCPEGKMDCGRHEEMNEKCAPSAQSKNREDP